MMEGKDGFSINNVENDERGRFLPRVLRDDGFHRLKHQEEWCAGMGLSECARPIICVSVVGLLYAYIHAYSVTVRELRF